MILAEIRGYGEQRNIKYRRDRAYCPIADPGRVPIHEEDTTFDNLQKEVKKPTRKAQERATWISEATWRLSDQRTDLRRSHPMDQWGLWMTSRRFQVTLQEDRRQKVSAMGEKTKALLTAGYTSEVWRKIKRWCR